MVRRAAARGSTNPCWTGASLQSIESLAQLETLQFA